MIKKKKYLSLESYVKPNCDFKITHSYQEFYDDAFELEKTTDEFIIYSPDQKMTLRSETELAQVYSLIKEYMLEKGINEYL